MQSPPPPVTRRNAPTDRGVAFRHSWVLALQQAALAYPEPQNSDDEFQQEVEQAARQMREAGLGHLVGAPGEQQELMATSFMQDLSSRYHYSDFAG